MTGDNDDDGLVQTATVMVTVREAQLVIVAVTMKITVELVQTVTVGEVLMAMVRFVWILCYPERVYHLVR